MNIDLKGSCTILLYMWRKKEQAKVFGEAIAIVKPWFIFLLHIISLVKNLVVAADRDGNCDLHVTIVSDSMPFLKECDCLQYFDNGGGVLQRNHQSFRIQQPLALQEIQIRPVGDPRKTW